MRIHPPPSGTEEPRPATNTGPCVCPWVKVREHRPQAHGRGQPGRPGGRYHGSGPLCRMEQCLQPPRPQRGAHGVVAVGDMTMSG